MINIFDKEATVFTNNGLATLEPMECLFDASINGVWKLTMRLPYDPDGKSMNVTNDMILKVTGIDCIAEQTSNYQLFRIVDVKRGDSAIDVIAYPIFLDSRYDTFTESLKLYDTSAAGAVNSINTWLATLDHHPYSVSLGGAQYWSDEHKSGEYTRSNLMAILGGENSFVDIWGGDIIYDNYTAKIEYHAGTYTPVDVRYGKNILGMSYDLDSSNVVTCLYPKAKSGETLNAIEEYEISPGYPCVFADNASDYPVLHILAADAPYNLVQLSNDGSAEYLASVGWYDGIMQNTRFWLFHALTDRYENYVPILDGVELDWIVQNYALTMANDGVEGIVEHMWRQVVTGRLYSDTVKNLVYSAMKAAFDEVLTDSSSGWYIGSASKKMWADSMSPSGERYYYSYNWDTAGEFRVKPSGGVDYIWVYASSKWQQLDSDGLTTGATDKTTWKWYKVSGKSWKRYGNQKKKRYLRGNQNWKINDVWYWFKSDGEPIKGSALMTEWLPYFDSAAVVWESGAQPQSLYYKLNVIAKAAEQDLFQLLYTQMTNYCTNLFDTDKLSYPALRVDINFVDLSQTTEYANFQALEKIHLGDAVNVRNEKLGVPLLTERIIGLTYDVLRKCNTEIHIGLTQSSVVNLLNSIGKSNNDTRIVFGDSFEEVNGKIEVKPPSTPYLTDAIVNGRTVVRNHIAYFDFDEMGIEETIDVLYGEDVPDNEDDGEDKDFYLQLHVETADIISDTDYGTSATETNPIDIYNFTRTDRNHFSLDITGKPNNRGDGETVWFGLHGLVVGHTYNVSITLHYNNEATFPWGDLRDRFQIGETRFDFVPQKEEQTVTGTFTYNGEEVCYFTFPKVNDGVVFTCYITDFIITGDFAGEIENLYNKCEGVWKKYEPPVMIGATSLSDGEKGSVPKPLIAERDKFLRGDRTWAHDELSKLTDVEITDLADGDIPKWDSTEGKWVNGHDELSKLADFEITDIQDGDVPKWDSTEGKWKNGQGGGGGAISDLTDVDLTNLADGEILKYDATEQKWLNAVESGGGGGNALILDAQIYSLEEKQVGVWTDGKPLYQKTIDKSLSVVTNHATTLGILGTEESGISIKNYTGFFLTNSTFYSYSYYKDSSNYFTATLTANNDDLNVKPDMNVSTTIYAGIITIWYTKDSDVAGSGGYQAYGFSPIIYSEEEREVGVWKDGKPLYQITFNLQLSGNQGTVDISSLNVETGWIYDGYYDIGVTNLSHNEWLTSSQFTRTHLNDALNPPYIDCYCRGWNNVPASVTIRYTKTTDVAGSGSYNTLGVPNVHYTENEQVIGTWVNGKPIYQKTVVVSSGFTQNMTVNHNISNIDEYVGFEGVVKTGNHAAEPIIDPAASTLSIAHGYDIRIADYSETGFAMHFDNTRLSQVQKVYVTLKYTKTTD